MSGSGGARSECQVLPSTGPWVKEGYYVMFFVVLLHSVMSLPYFSVICPGLPRMPTLSPLAQLTPMFTFGISGKEERE